MKNTNLRVWTCKIVIDADELPGGFDAPPRMAAQQAIEDAGFTVIMNSSGWGGTLDKEDKEYLKNQEIHMLHRLESEA